MEKWIQVGAGAAEGAIDAANILKRRAAYLIRTKGFGILFLDAQPLKRGERPQAPTRLGSHFFRENAT